MGNLQVKWINEKLSLNNSSLYFLMYISVIPWIIFLKELQQKAILLGGILQQWICIVYC